MNYDSSLRGVCCNLMDTNTISSVYFEHDMDEPNIHPAVQNGDDDEQMAEQLGY